MKIAPRSAVSQPSLTTAPSKSSLPAVPTPEDGFAPTEPAADLALEPKPAHVTLGPSSNLVELLGSDFSRPINVVVEDPVASTVGMTDFTRRTLSAAGLTESQAAKLFVERGNLRPMVAHPERQRVSVPTIEFPEFLKNANAGTGNAEPMRMKLPLSALDISPLTQAEFLEQLSGAELAAPFLADADEAATVKVGVERAADGSTMLVMAFERTNADAISAQPLVMRLLLGQPPQHMWLEVSADRLMLDERASHRIGIERNLRTTERSLAELARDPVPNAHLIKFEQANLERYRAELAAVPSQTELISPAKPAYQR